MRAVSRARLNKSLNVLAHCPNCSKQIEETADQCPSCGALFSGSTSWNPGDKSRDIGVPLAKLAFVSYAIIAAIALALADGFASGTDPQGWGGFFAVSIKIIVGLPLSFVFAYVKVTPETLQALLVLPILINLAFLGWLARRRRR